MFSIFPEAEKAGKFHDELESVRVVNGKIVETTAVNGSPLPNEVNYAFDDDDDERPSVRL